MESTIKSPTMMEVLWPAPTASSSLATLKNLGLAIAFSLLTAVAAQFALPLPFTPVPITLQSPLVLLTGVLLGSRWGAVAMTFYLLEGMAGLPFFANGNAGLDYLLVGRGTGGYLMSYPAAAFLTGWLAEQGWDRRVGTAVLAMLLGSAVILLGGAAWGIKFVGAANVLPLYILPFVPGDIVKTLAAAALLPSAWKVIRRFRQ